MKSTQKLHEIGQSLWLDIHPSEEPCAKSMARRSCLQPASFQSGTRTQGSTFRSLCAYTPTVESSGCAPQSSCWVWLE